MNFKQKRKALVVVESWAVFLFVHVLGGGHDPLPDLTAFRASLGFQLPISIVV
jgi:hypothetical protein